MTNIIAVENNEIVDLTNIDKACEKAEKQLAVLEKFIDIAIRRTGPDDWVDQGGKPYLQATGCEKIAPVFGIKLLKAEYKKEDYEDDKGKYYIYVYTGCFSWAYQNSFVAVGSRSSRDKFFGKQKDGSLKELSGLKEPDIMASAYSNMFANGIKRMLGIRNITWERLKAARIETDKVAKIDYKPNVSAQDKDPQKQIWMMLLEMFANDDEAAATALQNITSFKSKEGKIVDGLRDVKDLYGKRLEIALSKVKKEFEKYKKDLEAQYNIPPGGDGNEKSTDTGLKKAI